MKHYSGTQWQRFAAGEIRGPERRAMEEHLAGCGACQAALLAGIGPGEVARAAGLVPAGFAGAVMARVRQDAAETRRRDYRRNTLFYYVAASIVTILLMQGGFFTRLPQAAPPAVFAAPPAAPAQASLPWPGGIVDSVARWLTDFENPPPTEVSE